MSRNCQSGVELAAITDAHTYSARKNRTQAARAMREQLASLGSAGILPASRIATNEEIAGRMPALPANTELLCDGIGNSPHADAAELARGGIGPARASARNAFWAKA